MATKRDKRGAIPSPPQGTHATGRVYLVEHMEQDGIKPAELARLMGTHRANITRYRKSDRGISQQVLARIAVAMGKEPGDLLRPPEQYQPKIDKLLRNKPEKVVTKIVKMVHLQLEIDEDE